MLEASEYVEQLDGLLLRAATEGPDLDALQRAARALRGSATMAKLQSFAELASAVESVGRSLRQRAIPWEPSIRAVLTAAVDDLKLLVRAARSWSAADDQSAMKRVAELASYASAAAIRTPSGTVTSSAFFANEANNIAAGLELLATRPDDKDGVANVLRRVRALHGVAGVRDVRTLPEVLGAAESAMRPLEGGQALGADRVEMLRAAAELLRLIASGLTTGQTVRESSPEYAAFVRVLDTMRAGEEGADRVVPVSDLFYSDAGPHVVSSALNPPTTPAQRFRMEVVSLGEHVQRVLADARAAVDDLQRENARRELHRVLRAIRATASSFGEHGVAAAVDAHLARTEHKLDASALDAVASFAATISPAALAPTPAMQPVVRPGVQAAENRPGTSQQRGAPAPARRREPFTLDGAIAVFDSLADQRLAEPVALPDDVVPVDALLYRGRAALDRAIELSEWLRKAGGAPAREVLEELHDLLELARAE